MNLFISGRSSFNTQKIPRSVKICICPVASPRKSKHQKSKKRSSKELRYASSALHQSRGDWPPRLITSWPDVSTLASKSEFLCILWSTSVNFFKRTCAVLLCLYRHKTINQEWEWIESAERVVYLIQYKNNINHVRQIAGKLVQNELCNSAKVLWKNNYL